MAGYRRPEHPVRRMTTGSSVAHIVGLFAATLDHPGDSPRGRRVGDARHGASATAAAQRARRAAQHRAVPHRRHAGRRPGLRAVHPEVLRPGRARFATRSPTTRCAARPGPRSSPAATPTTTTSSTSSRRGASGPSTTAYTVATALQGAGYQTALRRQVHEPLRRTAVQGHRQGLRPLRARGLDAVVRHPRRQHSGFRAVPTTTSTPPWNADGRDRAQPRAVLHRPDRRQVPAAGRRSSPEDPDPFFLHISTVAPHFGGPREADDPQLLRHFTPARPRGCVAASTRCCPSRPGVPSFTRSPEADVRDKTWPIRSLPEVGHAAHGRRPRAGPAAGRDHLRHRPAVQETHRAAARHRRARQHGRHLHLRQRPLPGRAPQAHRQAAPLRTVVPGPVAGARPRRPAGRAGLPGHHGRPGRALLGLGSRRGTSCPTATDGALVQHPRSTAATRRMTCRSSTRRWSPAMNADRHGLSGIGVRTSRWKFVLYNNGRAELYDLVKDRRLHQPGVDPRGTQGGRRTLAIGQRPAPVQDRQRENVACGCPRSSARHRRSGQARPARAGGCRVVQAAADSSRPAVRPPRR